MNARKTYVIVIFFILNTSFFSCSNKESKPIIKGEIKKSIIGKAEAESFVNSSAEIKIHEGTPTFIKTENDGWIAVDINIPIAGRYQLNLRTANKSSKEIICWVEDYIDNIENRVYNISNDIKIPAHTDDFEIFSKVGIPLNKGLHKMKIHFDSPIEIDFLEFKILKEHIETSHLLVQKTDGEEWVKVWSDEFEEASLDPRKWTLDFGDWGWGNGELQNYTDNKDDNTRIENGSLIIEARKDVTNNTWTSARLTSREKISFLYGKFEIFAKLPPGEGSWAAAWLLGDEYVDESSWPYCGEIDILESVGYELDDKTGNGIVHASAHSASNYFKLGNHPKAQSEVRNMSDQFHLYAIEWTPEEISFYVDDLQYFVVSKNVNKSSWPFSKPHNIILNIAIGGSWGANHGVDEKIQSHKMIVDYVRVYEKR